MLLDTGKLGSLLDIQRTDFRDILFFMMEYPLHKEQKVENKKYVSGDLTDFA